MVHSAIKLTVHSTLKWLWEEVEIDTSENGFILKEFLLVLTLHC